MMTTRAEYIGYGETSGGPLCIAEVEKATGWSGAEEPGGDYWNLIEMVNTSEAISYYKQMLIFGTETGNFLLFKTSEGLIITEAIYSAGTRPAEIIFSKEEIIDLRIKLTGDLLIYDSSLALYDIPTQTGWHKLDDAGQNNSFVMTGSFTQIQLVDYKSDEIHLRGIHLI